MFQYEVGPPSAYTPDDIIDGDCYTAEIHVGTLNGNLLLYAFFFLHPTVNSVFARMVAILHILKMLSNSE